MTDPRLERLRQLDAAATPGSWVLWDKSEAGYLLLGFTGDEPAEHIYSEADAEWIATARRILGATINLLESIEDYQWPLPATIRLAALAVLDQVGCDDA